MSEAAAKFLEFLQQPPISLVLSDDEARALRSASIIERYYSRGTVILHEGYTRRAILFVSSGWGLAYKSMSNGKRLVSDFLLHGDLISTGSIAGRTFRSVVATTNVSIFELSPHDLFSLSRNSPYLFVLIMRLVARNFGIATERLANISRRRPVERTAWLFLEIAHRISQMGPTARDGYDFPFTQGDLGDALGLTSIHMNRVLGELRRREIMTFRAGRVDLLDIQAMLDMTMFDPGYLSHQVPRDDELERESWVPSFES